MPIYVDELFKPQNSRYKWCHMATDESIETLERFAVSIGLQKKWLHNHKTRDYSIPHYDLTANKRNLAVARGAIPITSKELLERCKKNA